MKINKAKKNLPKNYDDLEKKKLKNRPKFFCPKKSCAPKNICFQKIYLKIIIDIYTTTEKISIKRLTQKSNKIKCPKISDQNFLNQKFSNKLFFLNKVRTKIFVKFFFLNNPFENNYRYIKLNKSEKNLDQINQTEFFPQQVSTKNVFLSENRSEKNS